MIARGVFPLVDARTMRELDRYTIDDIGVPGEVLMESAGRASAELVLRELAALSGGDVRVVCGRGNNGGDGLVVARHLRMLGLDVGVTLLAPEAELAADAASNLVRARRVGVRIERDAPLPERGVVVDAIFGTGLSREVSGLAAERIRAINAARERALGALRVVAIDLPSGLDADTGQVLGCAVQADVTAAISLPKLGLVLEPGRTYAGAVFVLRIGIVDETPGTRPHAALWSPGAAAARLPRRASSGHKGTFGHVLLVAGSLGKTGAAALAAAGALRAGAGLVTLACPAGLNAILETKCTEAMTVPVAETADHALAAAAEQEILALARERDVVAMGPGVGRSRETVALMRALAERVDVPLVIDADGLFAFAEHPEALAARRAPTLLTPHPGEAARLLGCTNDEVNRDRVAAARTLARRTGATVLLKGPATIAANPEGDVLVNPTGGPGLGTGGTGDVLLGMVAAYVAQGVAPLEAAALAAYVHGAAGDRLDLGAGGRLASDVATAVPQVAAALLEAAAREPIAPGAGGSLAVPLPGR